MPTGPDAGFDVERATQSREPEIPKKPSSFLQPTGPAANVPIPREKSVGPLLEWSLFAFFVVTRAIHPSIIAASKVVLDPETGKKGYEYASGTTVIVMCIVVVTVGMAISAAQGEFMSIWKWNAIKVFSINGIVYAVGDWLEMLSLGSLAGAAYQVLLQSKFLFTALFMMYLKGTKQSPLQWILLMCMMLSASVYMAISSTGESKAPIDGMTFALLKVIISCLGAVISDKFMKEFKDTPIHIQLVQMGIARFFASFGLSFIGTDIWGNGFFHGWNVIVSGVAVSFVVKSVSTLYLVALLDAMLKNIGEALAILVIYAWDVVAERVLCIDGCTEQAFQVPPLLSAIIIVLTVAAYLEAKTMVKKGK